MKTETNLIASAGSEAQLLKIVQGRLIETIGREQPMPRALMRWKVKQLRDTTHKLGELIPVKAN